MDIILAQVPAGNHAGSIQSHGGARDGPQETEGRGVERTEFYADFKLPELPLGVSVTSPSKLINPSVSEHTRCPVMEANLEDGKLGLLRAI